MRIIVHAGANKAGSTAVQEYLHLVRDEMQTGGILYPALDDTSHWKLSVALMPRQDGVPVGETYLQRRALKHNVRPGHIRRRVARAIAAASPDSTVILSDESFSAPVAAAALARFLAEIAPKAERLAIAYIRPPHSAYPSEVQQLIKGRRRIVPPSRWVWSHPARAKGLRRAFDGAVFRAYDRGLLADGDVVEDFRRLIGGVIGRDLPAAPRAFHSNASLSAPVAALLHGLGEAFPDADGAYGRMRRALERFSRERSDPKLQLPAEWHATIAERNHVPWNAAVDLFPYDRGVRDKLRLAAPEGEVKQVGDAEVRRWLASYLDGAFLHDFVAFLEAGGGHAIGSKALAWLERQA